MAGTAQHLEVSVAVVAALVFRLDVVDVGFAFA